MSSYCEARRAKFSFNVEIKDRPMNDGIHTAWSNKWSNSLRKDSLSITTSTSWWQLLSWSRKVVQALCALYIFVTKWLSQQLAHGWLTGWDDAARIALNSFYAKKYIHLCSYHHMVIAQRATSDDTDGDISKRRTVYSKFRNALPVEDRVLCTYLTLHHHTCHSVSLFFLRCVRHSRTGMECGWLVLS